MKALVLCNDYWHPASMIRTGLGAIEKRGYAFDWVEDTTDWSPQHLATYPVVVFTRYNHISPTDQRPWMTEDIQNAFVDYVHRGGGLLVIHSGVAGYEDWPGLRGLMGGAFVSHPSQCPVSVEPREGHRLTAGSSLFTLTDEHYFIDLDDDGADVFLTAVSEHGRQPGGWTRTAGAGRVCVLAPSHNLEGWLHPSYQPVIYNALRWCGDDSFST